jgi:hypothetical protein
MSISFVAAGTVAVGNVVTVTQPTGIIQGDLLLLISSGGSKPGTPAGWTELTTNYFISPAAPWMTIYRKFASAAEASVSLTTNALDARSVIVAYRGAYEFEPIPSFAYGAGGTANLIPIRVTSNYRYDTMLSIYSTTNSGFATTFTANGSTITRVNSSSTGSSVGLLVVDEFQNPSGNSIPKTATQSRSQAWGAVSIGLVWPQKYWVGGSNTWDVTAGTKWANTSGASGGAPLPTTTDEVIFDANSGGANTITITSTVSIASLNCLGFSGTLNGNLPLTISNGDILLSSSMEYNYNGPITFTGNQTANISANSKIINSNITITKATNSSVILLNNIFSTTTNTTIFNSGILNLNNFVLTTGSFLSSNTTTRGISFGTGNSGAIVLTSSGNTWNTSVVTGLTVSGTSNVTVANSSANPVTITTGALTAAQALNFNYNTGTYTLTDISAVYNSLNFTGFTGTVSNQTRTVFGNFTANTGPTYNGGTLVTTFANTTATQLITANATINYPIIFGVSAGATYQLNTNVTIATTNTTTLTAGTLNLNNFLLRTGSFNSSGSLVRAINFGTSNTGAIVLTSSGTPWNTGTVTSLTVSGNSNVTVANASANPVTVTTGALTAAQALNFNYNTGTYTLTDASSVYNSLNFTEFTGTVTNQTRTVFGNFTANTGPTYSAGALITTFANTTARQLITSNATLNFPITFGVTAGGTYQLNSNLTIATTNTSTHTAGTLNLNNFLLRTGSFASSGALVRAINFGTGTSGAIVLTSSGTPWNTGTVTNLTVSGNSNVTVANASANPVTVTTGALTAAQALNFNYNAGTYTLGDASAVYNSLNFTGFSGTISNQTRTLFGNLIAGTGTTYTAGTLATTFANTTTTQTITSNGKTFDFPITHTGPILSFTDTFLQGVTRTFTLATGTSTINVNSQSVSPGILTLATGTATINTGTLTPVSVTHTSGSLTLGTGNVTTTGTYTFTAGTLALGATGNLTTGIFSSSGSSVRAIQFGTGQITLTGNNSTIWNTTTATSFTWTGTPRIISTFAGSTGIRTFSLGSMTVGTMFNVSANGTTGITLSSNNPTDTIALIGSANAVNLVSLSSGFIPGTGGASVFGNLIIGSTTTLGGSANTLIFANTVGTQFITSGGQTILFPVTFGVSAGATYQLQNNLTLSVSNTTTLTAGSLNLNNNILSTGLFSSSGSLTRAINFGTGGINVTGNNATVWNTTTSTGFSYAGTPVVNSTYAGATGTRTIAQGITGGSPTTSNIAFNISSGTDTVAITTASQMGDLNFTGFSGTFAPPAALTLYSNLIASSAMTWTTGTGTITFASNATGRIITTADKTLNNITFNGVGGGWTLQDNLTTSVAGTLNVTAGAVNANNKILTVGRFSSNSNTFIRSVTNVPTINITGNSATVLEYTSANLTLGNTSTNANLTYTGATGTRTVYVLGGATPQYINFTAFGIDTINTNLLSVNRLDFSSFTGTFNINGSIRTGANVTFSSGMSTNAASIPSLTIQGSNVFFAANNKTIGSLSLNASGTTQITGNLICLGEFGTSGSAFNTNNFNITSRNFVGRGDSSAINFGTSTWTLTGADSDHNNLTPAVWRNDTSRNGENRFLASNLTIILAGTNNNLRTIWNYNGSNTTYGNIIIGGGSSTGNVRLLVSRGVGSVLGGTFGVGNLSSTRTGSYNLILSANTAGNAEGNLISVNTWSISGSSVANAVNIISQQTGTQATLFVASGTVFPGISRIRDSQAIGGAYFDGSSSLNLGNNTGWSNFPAANVRYWVNGTGTWNASNTTNWSGFSGGTGGYFLPTSTDTAVFDSSSGSGTVTLSGAIPVGNLNAVNSSVSFAGTGTPTISGNLLMSSSTVWNANGVITFNASGNLGTNNANILASITFNNTTAGWTQTTDLTSNLLTLTAGTFNANNYNVYANQVSISGTSTRTLTMGNGSWFLTSTANVPHWNATTITGLTFNKNNANIYVSANSGSNTITFNGGTLTYNNLFFTNTTSNGSIIFTEGSTFYDINLSRTGNTNLIFPAGVTTTFNGANGILGLSGTSNTNLLSFNSSTPGTRAIINKTGNTALSFVNIRDISFTPYTAPTTNGSAPATFFWSADPTNSTNSFNNSGIIFGTLGSVRFYTLLTGTSWTVPSDWNNNNNTINLYGGGGGGAGGFVQETRTPIGSGRGGGGAGGGGGGYTSLTNQTLSGSVAYSIGAGGTAGSIATGGNPFGWRANGASGGTTTFGPSATANGGGGGIFVHIQSSGVENRSGGTGGTGTTFNGGGGAPGQSAAWINQFGIQTFYFGGSGGGGAGGPTGAGGGGATGASGFSTPGTGPTGGGGGAGNQGSIGSGGGAPAGGNGGTSPAGGGAGGTGGGPAIAAQVGGSGSEIFGVGAGGGGGGGNYNVPASRDGAQGGLYGGGGGGCGNFQATVGSAAAGRQGAIAIVYVIAGGSASANSGNYFLLI